MKGISIQVEDACETEPHRGWIGWHRDVTTFGPMIDAFVRETDADVDIAAGAIPAPESIGRFGLVAVPSASRGLAGICGWRGCCFTIGAHGVR